MAQFSVDWKHFASFSNVLLILAYGMKSVFDRSLPELSLISNHLLDFVHTYRHSLQDFTQTQLSPQQLERQEAAISDKGSPLKHCCGFIDGTVRPACPPGSNQRVLYNGHKRVHAKKFQSVAAPNGMIANLYGPVESKRHDTGMLAMSGLLPQLQLHARTRNGSPLCVCGDPVYPPRVQLQGSFKGNLNQQQKDYNQAMSRVRTSVEQVFAKDRQLWGAGGGMPPPHFLSSKQKEKQREKKRVSKPKTINKAVIKVKIILFQPLFSVQNSKFFLLGQPRWLTIFFSVPWPLHFESISPALMTIQSILHFWTSKKSLKIQLSEVGKMSSVCALLTKAHTCLYQSMTSSYFGILV